MTQWLNWRRLLGIDIQAVPPPWLPPMTVDPAKEDNEVDRKSPLATPLYVQSGSAVVRADNGLVIVEREGEPKFERPVELVSAVHILGWATITSPCVSQLMNSGIPVIWRGPTGFPVGIATPMHQAGLEIRRAQYHAAGSQQGFDIAKTLVSAKILNMRGVMRRRAARSERNHLDFLRHQARQASRVRTLDVLLGIEGAATARYFAVWPEMMRERAGELTFAGRNRRPPQDEINALLSYAYAVLAGECLSACVAAGLDPRQGLFHRPRAGRPALALDLMEPFRPLIADQAILRGLNNGQMKHEHFRHDGAILLTDGGRRLAIGLIEQRLLGLIRLGGRAEALTWRETIEHSARALADSLKTNKKFLAVELA
jgi:CRISPR-associated protein Cas1